MLSHLLDVPWNEISKKPEINVTIIRRSFLPRKSKDFLHKKQNTPNSEQAVLWFCDGNWAGLEAADALNQNTSSAHLPSRLSFSVVKACLH